MLSNDKLIYLDYFIFQQLTTITKTSPKYCLKNVKNELKLLYVLINLSKDFLKNNQKTIQFKRNIFILF